MTNFNCLGKQGCIDAYINGLKTKRPLLVVALNISTAQNYNHTHCDSWVTRRDVKAHYCLVGAESDISQRYGLHYGNQIFAVMSVCTLLQCYTIFFVWWISRRKPGQSQEERTMVLIGDVVADYLDYPSNMPRSQAVCAYPQVRCRKRGFRGPGLSAAAFIPHIISARDSSSIGYSSRFRSLLGAPGLNMSIPAIVKLGFSLNPGYLGLLVTFLGAVPPPGGEEIPARVHAAEDVVLPTLPAPHHVITTCPPKLPTGVQQYSSRIAVLETPICTFYPSALMWYLSVLTEVAALPLVTTSHNSPFHWTDVELRSPEYNGMDMFPFVAYMARLSRLQFLGVAVTFHLLYVCSIFDVYFVSPVVGGMKAHRVQTSEPPPAQRVVLFVADGLRADKTFQQFPDPSPDAPANETAQILRHLAPFLRSRVLEYGTFGVSHTRVPTESRPGHVALLAGLYEDVSAVTTGWKLNPVGFDSVLNRSRHTWSWGSPDILPMFAHGAEPGRVDTYMYSADAEDFSKDAIELDRWVFDGVKRFFNSATEDIELEAALRQDKNIFFLHLLGLDTSGHAYRPYSREYLHNIQVVDQGVRELTALFEAFFADDQTAFVFTADHGMSDWGSHGDGHPDNTRTPLIAWGAGVPRPRTGPIGNVARGHDDFSADWYLDHVERNDVAQADIAVLMAYLAGIPYPVNSVGRLPLSYIDADESGQAEALLVNAQEILEMYRVKERRTMAKKFWYVPFAGLADDRDQTTSQEERISRIRAAIDKDNPEQAIQECQEFIDLTLQGLRYLQTYDWLFLRALISMGYLGWMAFALTTALTQHGLLNSDKNFQLNRSSVNASVLGIASIALLAFLYLQSSPYHYYAYATFPILFWAEVLAYRGAWIRAIRTTSKQFSASNVTTGTVGGLAFGLLLEAIVQSFHDRTIYTLVYVLAIFWPLMYGAEFILSNWFLCLAWALQCASMSIFTLLPANKTEDTTLITLGGVLMFAFGVWYLIFETKILNRGFSERETVATDRISKVGLVPLALLVTLSAAASLQSKEGLPRLTQLLSWTILVSSFVLPFLHSRTGIRHHIHRLVVIFFTFAPLFILLTISYEVPPTPSYQQQRQRNRFLPPSSTPTSFRCPHRPLLPLPLSHSAFFSTGNIASISSFSLDAVLRLIPVFEPFSQSALLILKILAPFVPVSANLGILTRSLRLRPGALFVLVVAASDYLTLRFFWRVRDEGSWLEIGESITVFVLASLLCGFVAVLEMVGEGSPIAPDIYSPIDLVINALPSWACAIRGFCIMDTAGLVHQKAFVKSKEAQ
ncbi:GPI ethanolamine phosphate transferase 1 [Aspergillus tanneri]|uniref:GPI ethanolamine phosphate transferase 1 n=1 Tax=Aspergillus tanneri TaxID=1220188 RepID=A0A5M9ML20_9EURO|nr:Glycosyl phosphatidyl inositol anchor synthesis [Aspergillus tanneri]KAA8645129.1 Glycosyl phosphatidyl inositol anchor synthesis [Aspergillus tanneri]